MSKKISIIVVIVLMAIMALLSSGCQSSMTVKSAAFYPKENDGQVHKSRTTAANDGKYWHFGLGE